jgi:hypothetical protein
MSLTDNERDALINLYWEKSKATMKEAKANYHPKTSTQRCLLSNLF